MKLARQILTKKMLSYAGMTRSPPTADDKVGARQELSADDTELPIRKLKLETEILARQLKPRYFLLEVAKAIAGPVAVLGLMWTIVVGISQQGALQQSKEDERFDKAVTRLAGPSPTERLTGLAGLQLFLEPEYKSHHRGTLSFLVNALVRKVMLQFAARYSIRSRGLHA